MNLFGCSCLRHWERNIALVVLVLVSLGMVLHASASSTPITIRLAGDEWFLDSLTKTGVIDEFQQKTGIHVQVLRKNDRAILGDLDRGPSSDQETLDVIVVRHRLLGTLVQKGQVREIDSLLSDPALRDAGLVPPEQKFTDWWLELSSYAGHTYGFPFTGLTTYLCYRKDLLDDPANQRDFEVRYHRKLTVPATWPEYNEVAEFFTRPEQHFYGTYIQGKQGLALWYEWLNLAYSFGGNILDAKHGWEYGDIVVNSPENVAATNEYVKLIAFSPPDTLHFGWGEAQSALQLGRVFMGLLWNDQAPFLEDPAVSKVAGKIGYARIPSNTGKPFSQLEGLTYLIPTESKHAREAYRFMEFALSREVQIKQTLDGGSSLRKSTYDDPRVKQLPYTAPFLEALAVGKGKPTIAESPQMTDAMVLRLSAIVRGENTAKTGLDLLALDLQAILGKGDRLRFPVQARAVETRPQ
jgi:multiple sugar transport system substrate-binding protein